MTDRQLITLTTTIGTCVLVTLERTQPPHAKLARQIKKVEEALKDLACLTGNVLETEHMTIGTEAWQAAMAVIQERVK